MFVMLSSHILYYFLRSCTLSINKKLYNEEFPLELQKINSLENYAKKSKENTILSKEICFHIILHSFVIIFILWVLVFRRRVSDLQKYNLRKC